MYLVLSLLDQIESPAPNAVRIVSNTSDQARPFERLIESHGPA